MSGDWRVRVDPLRCIGSGICTSAAPRHFVLVEGRSTLIADVVSPAKPVIDAAGSCPMEAITVRDEQGRLIAPEP